MTMRDERWEQVLRDKLRDDAVAPPPGLWARLEERLADDAALRPARPAIRIGVHRRPLGGRMLARYAVAAVLLVGLVLWLERTPALDPASQGSLLADQASLNDRAYPVEDASLTGLASMPVVETNPIVGETGRPRTVSFKQGEPPAKPVPKADRAAESARTLLAVRGAGAVAASSQTAHAERSASSSQGSTPLSGQSASVGTARGQRATDAAARNAGSSATDEAALAYARMEGSAPLSGEPVATGEVVVAAGASSAPSGIPAAASGAAQKPQTGHAAWADASGAGLTGSGSQAAKETARQRWAEVLGRSAGRAEREGIARTRSTSLYASNIASTGGGGAGRQAAASFNVNEVVDDPMTGSGMATAFQTVRRPADLKLRHHMPVSVGVGFSFRLGRRWAIETGLLYTFMESSSDASGTFAYRTRQQLHYLGVPLSVSFDVLRGRRGALYVRAGGAVERALSARQERTIRGDNHSSETTDLRIRGLQPSVNVAVGGELFLAPVVGLYIEPGLSHYFSGSQPVSYRTAHPTAFSLRAGVRFHF